MTSTTNFYHTHDCSYCKVFSKYRDDHPNRYERLIEWTKHLGFKTYREFVLAEMARVKELTSSSPSLSGSPTDASAPGP